eukprot:m.30729 g.30729  ORF g.30729 m.30729 type:complete len:530 (+) comp31382_c0_seq3:134-1723(+)
MATNASSNGTQNATDLCLSACSSSRGVCVGGNCACFVQYRGGDCESLNLPYVISFGSLFCLISVISFSQLVLLSLSDYQKADKNKWSAAFKRTTAKILHLLTALATLTRGLYFILKDHVSNNWSLNLQSAYYPLLLCSVALVVCFWAEIYAKGSCISESQFLHHSSMYYSVFCFLMLGIIGMEWLLNILLGKQAVSWVFDGLWAGLILFVLIFFVVYGVLVFGKVKGAFVPLLHQTNAQQLCMSRVGVFSQATFQLLVVFLLVFNHTSQEHYRWSLTGINIGLVSLRLLELGITLWFICALWNCRQPENLWILNPSRILKCCDGSEEEHSSILIKQSDNYRSTSEINKKGQCWICYDRDSTDVLIRPCKCSGDLSAVHHDCLKKWVMQEGGKASFSQSSDHPHPCCKVCQEKVLQLSVSHCCNGSSLKYDIDLPPDKWRFPQVPGRCWVKVSVLFIVLCGFCVGAQQAVHHDIPGSLQGLVISAVIIVGLILLRQIAVTLIEGSFYARIKRMKIRSKQVQLQMSASTSE